MFQSSAHCDGAIAEPAWVDAGFHQAKLDVHEQHRVAIVVEPRIHLHVLQALAALVLLQNTADRLLDLCRYGVLEIALVGEGRHGGWAARG